MVDSIAKLQSLVDSHPFLASVTLESIDEQLDARDADPFDAEWTRLRDAINSRHLEPAPIVDALREAAFMRAYAITHHSELCGYVSDDFGLLADALRAELPDSWASSLFSAYCRGALPHGELPRTSKPLREAVDEFNP